jgi:hypothetical protein
MLSTARPLTASALLGLLGLSLTGCASVVWSPRIDTVPGEYKSTQAVTRKAEDLPDGAAADVKAVSMMELPPGLAMRDGVLRYDPQVYEMLGAVSAAPVDRLFYPYREGWRRPFCYPQQALVAATLFAWYIMPTYWPCFAAAGPESEQRDSIVEALKRATKAMGGDLLLIRGFESGNPGFFTGGRAGTGYGYALKIKGRPPALAPSQADVSL